MNRVDMKRLVTLGRGLLPGLILMSIAYPVLELMYGSICVLTVGTITISCPLGFLQANLASHGLILGLLIPASVIVTATILLGRLFCGWICPAGPIIQRFENARPFGKTVVARVGSTGADGKTRMVLLLSLLAASVLLRYPVFCVVCPVGIIYRNAISLVRYGSIGFDLLFIPMLVFLQRSLTPWCSHICPLGTLFSILGRMNPLVPIINRARCTSCRICERVCKMKVPLLSGRNLENCSKCLDCSLQCPTKAIEWMKRAKA